MLPRGYQGLVVADTRRAVEWESGLRARGFDVVRAETTGADADKGAWQIGVATSQKLEAQAFVTRVINGDARLPARPFLSRTAWLALLGIALAALALLALGSGCGDEDQCGISPDESDPVTEEQYECAFARAQSCRDDADCTLVNIPWGCGNDAVNVSYAAELEAMRPRVECSGICFPQFFSAAECVDRECQGVE